MSNLLRGKFRNIFFYQLRKRLRRRLCQITQRRKLNGENAQIFNWSGSIK